MNDSIIKNEKMSYKTYKITLAFLSYDNVFYFIL